MLNFVLWNAQGMASTNSQVSASLALQGLAPDVAFLTETNVNDSSPLCTRFPGSLWTTFRGRGHGVGVIPFNDRIRITPLPSPTADGRTLLCTVCLPAGLNINVLIVYAPASHDERIKWLKKFTADKIKVPVIHAMVGDFNCDVRGQDTDADAFRGLAHWFSLKEILPHDSGNTFFASGVPTSRIDTVFLHNSLLSLASPAKVGNRLIKSDHAPVCFSLTDSPPVAQASSSSWRLNPGTAKHLPVLLAIDRHIDTASQSKLTPTKQWKYLKHLVRTTYMTEQATIASERELLTASAKEVLKRTNSNHKYTRQEVLQLNSTLESNKRELLQKWAGVSWDLHNELPSPVLTAIIKRRQANNTVYSIRDPTGTIVTDTDSVLNSFEAFYRDLYQERPDDPIAHQQLLDSWEVPQGAVPSNIGDQITIQEVLDAIKSTDPDKAPGPDGITGWFYTLHAKKLAPLLTSLFNELLNGHSVPSHMKKGLISTIFKGKGDPLDIDNRRPITLLNIDYKILSKVLNSRLLKVLDKLINPRQAGFCPNRSIFSNIVLLSMVIEHANTRNEGSALMVDFFKAFDSISHGAIRRTLKHIGLPDNLISLIMSMYHGSSSQVSVNGRLSKSFPVERGTKQGDPLSPTIFVLVIECLSRALAAANLKGLPVDDSGNFNYHSLFFADDLLLMCRDDDDFNKAWSTLQLYCAATTSKINLSKTRWLGVEVPAITAMNISEVPNSGEKYLGIAFNSTGIVPQIPGKLIETRTLLQSIHHLNLSLIGRVNVLKTYALSKLNYLCYIHPMTPSDVESLNNTVKWFLWSRDKKEEDRRYRAGISLQRLWPDKLQGGLNLFHWGARSPAQLASLHIRALKQHPQDLYSPPWLAHYQAEHIYFDVVKYSVASYSLITKHAPVTTGNYPRLKEIYGPFLKSLEFAPTPGQQEWTSSYGCDWATIWGKLATTPAKSHQRSAVFRFFHRDFYAPKHHEQCNYHKTKITHCHLMFECFTASQVSVVCSAIDRQLTTTPINWRPSDILPLNFSGLDLILVSTRLWLTRRAIYKLHFDEGPSSDEIRSDYTKAISNTLSAILSQRIAHATRKAIRENPIALSQYVSTARARFDAEYNKLGALKVDICNIVLLDVK